MSSMEGRHWLWQFSVGVIDVEVIQERFGADIAEAFQLWVAMQEDTDRMVRNVADGMTRQGAADGASSSGSSTVAVEKKESGDKDDCSLAAADVANVVAGDQEGWTVPEGAADAGESTSTSEHGLEDHDAGAGVHEDLPVPATLPDGGLDSLEDDGLLEVPGDEREELLDVPGDGGGEEREGSLPLEVLEAARVEDNNMDVESGEQSMAHAEQGGGSGGADGMLDAAADAPIPPDPYDVPQAWRRVLAAWDDPSLGAGLEGSAVSNGDFEHAVSMEADAAVEGTQDEAAAEFRTAPTARTAPATEGSEAGLKQTNLRSWLK